MAENRFNLYFAFLTSLQIVFSDPSLVFADRRALVQVNPTPTPSIESTDDIFELIWRHDEPGAMEKLETILKSGVNLKGLKDEHRLGGCSPLANAVFATIANPSSSEYSEIRRKRYDHIPLLLKYGADVKQKCAERYGESPLHFAAEKGDVNLIYLLVENGADVNDKDNMGRTPLFTVFTGTAEAANLLLHLGADVEASSENGNPLTTAIYFTNPEIMEIFLQHGADPERKLNARGESVLEQARNRFKGDPSSSRLRKCVALLEKYRDLRKDFLTKNQTKTPNFSPPPKPALQLLPEKTEPELITATAKKDLSAVVAALQKSKNPNVVGTTGEMPLHLAVKSNSIEIARELIKKGANIEIRNADGLPPIYLARNNPEMLELLLVSGAKVDQTGPYQQTALQASENIESIKFLLKNGAKVNHSSRFGYNALFNAVSSRKQDVVKLFLDSGADINIQTEEGDTPLHKAVQNKDNGLVGLLLEKGANPNLKNMRGFTPYDLATAEKNTELVTLLSSKGASFGDKERIIREAIYNLNVEFVEKLLNEGVDVNLGLDLNNPYQSRPLILDAVRAYPQNSPKNKELLKLFITRGAEVKFTDSNQNSLLHLIGEPEVLELLLEKGLDINAVNDNRETPLHIVSAKGNLPAVKLLLSKKAFPNARNTRDMTPLELALHGPIDHRPGDGPAPDFANEGPRYLEIISLLLNAGAETTGLLEADLTKAPYYYSQGEGYTDFQNKAKELIKNSKSSVVVKPKPVVTESPTEIPQEDKLLLFRMISERFINKDDVIKYRPRDDISQVCNMPVLTAAQEIFKANPKFAGSFSEFLNKLHIFSPQSYESINSTETYPRREFQGYTLLHMAAYYNDLPLIRELIAAGADAKALDRQGNSVLHFAVSGMMLDEETHLQGIKALIAAGAEVNIINEAGENVLFDSRGIRFSGSKEPHHLTLFKFLVEQGANLTVKNYDGKTILDVLDDAKNIAEKYKDRYPAQFQQYDEYIRSLESKGLKRGDVVRGETGNKNSPLIDAVIKNELEQIAELIKAGADVNEFDRSRNTPLWHAVSAGNVEVVKLLIKSGAKVDHRSRRQSLISVALNQNRYQLLKFLIELGVKPSDYDLFSVASKPILDQQGKEAMKLLIDQGLKVNVCNDQGESPLFEAVSRGNVEASEILIASGARLDYCTKDPREVKPHQNKKVLLDLLEIKQEIGNSIYSKLVEMWNQTPNCRLRNPR